MPKRIFKYRIPAHWLPGPIVGQAVYAEEMPKGAVILSVGQQNDRPFVWALVDPAAPPSGRQIVIVLTGWETAADPGRFLGTIHLHQGRTVAHVFDMGETR